MSSMYPPYLEGTIPAFYESSGGAVEITVPFSMNRAVTKSSVAGFWLKIKTVQSNSYILDLFSDKFNLEFGTVTFRLKDEEFYKYENVELTEAKVQNYLKNYSTSTTRLVEANNHSKTITDISEYNAGTTYQLKKRRFNVGQFYKVQLAYTDKDEAAKDPGYYSTVAVTKFTTKPDVTIEGLEMGAVNLHRRTYVGKYSQSSLIEKVDAEITELEDNLSEIDENYDAQVADLNAKLAAGQITQSDYNTQKTVLTTTYNRKRKDAAAALLEAQNARQYAVRDVTEKAYSYQFILYDENGGVLRDSGVLLHNNSTDINNYESTDIYTLPLELAEGTAYYLQYTVTTNNNMTISSSKYRIMYAKSVNPEIQAKVLTKLDYDNGYIEISLEGAKEGGVENNVTGSFMISRSDDKSDFTIWDEITKFNLVGQTPSHWSWKDMTIEHGVKYRYALQQYNDNDLYSEKILSVCVDEDGKEIAEPLEAYFEDAFLFDGDRQLKIKYNPKVSSFKTDLMETKIDTIGSKYPFIFRNGAVEYKEFPISGLISYLSDEQNLFISDEDLDLTKNFTNWKRGTTLDSQLANASEDFFFDLENYSDLSYDEVETMRQGFEARQEQVKAIETAKQRTTNPEDYNIASERLFKLSVLDWLNNGKTKLFRSPAEGNYIVRLMNVSLSPEDRLGRMLHTFSCTAYEIAECTYENLMAYKLLNTVLTADRIYKTATVPLIKLNNDDGDIRYEQAENNAYYIIKDEILPAHKMVVGLRFEDIPYGYSATSGTNMIINGVRTLIKGDSPSYGIELGLTFESVKIDESLHELLTKSFSLESIPQVTIEYYEVSDSLFNTVTNITLDTTPARMWLGDTEHITQKYLNDNEIEELKKTNIILKAEGDKDLNYHQKITYQSNNLLDMLNSEKTNVLRFFYINLYKRDVTDEDNDDKESFEWKYVPNTNYIQNSKGVKIYLFKTSKDYEIDNTHIVDKDVLYKFILTKGQTFNNIYTTSNGRTTSPSFENDVICYYDVTHPGYIYYDNHIFVNNLSQYNYDRTTPAMSTHDLSLINNFNSRNACLKFKPYEITFTINNGDSVSVAQDYNGHLVTSRFRSTPFHADSITMTVGVGCNYCIESQTLSYYVEDNSKVLQAAVTNSNNDYYKLYNESIETITENTSAVLANEDYDETEEEAINNSVEEAYAELAKLYVNWFAVNNTSYVDYDTLRDKAILQIGRELALWKEETLY